MTKDDSELQAWRAEWQSLGGGAELERELAARVARDGQRLRRSIALELLASLLGALLCVWMLVRFGQNRLVAVVSSTILVFFGVWVTRLLSLREGQLREGATGVDAFVELTRRRLDADLRWNRFARASTVFLLVMMVPWTIWALVVAWDGYAAAPWRAIVAFGVPPFVFGGLFVSQARKRRAILRERAQLEALVAERTLV